MAGLRQSRGSKLMNRIPIYVSDMPLIHEMHDIESN